MTHNQISTSNGTIHYWIQKHPDPAAKCLVFTHGLTADHTMFDRQVEYFIPNYTVVTWDVPLHGRSRPYHDFSYKQTALDLNCILEAEDIPTAVLVGMSMGGYPSQMFGDLFPEKVVAFVALDTTPFGTQYYSKSDLWWLKQVEPMAKCFPDNMLRKSMAKSVSTTQYSYDKMLAMLKPLTKAEIAQQMGIAYGKFAAENHDINLSFPTLILLGDSDKTGKVGAYCKAWAKQTGYPLHIIPNAAHFSNGDNPEAVNREIEDFLKLCT